MAAASVVGKRRVAKRSRHAAGKKEEEEEEKEVEGTKEVANEEAKEEKVVGRKKGRKRPLEEDEVDTKKDEEEEGHQESEAKGSDLLERRLAAFGEAFWGSIEGPAPAPIRQAPVRLPGVGGSAQSGPGGKRKKRRGNASAPSAAPNAPKTANTAAASASARPAAASSQAGPGRTAASKPPATAAAPAAAAPAVPHRPAPGASPSSSSTAPAAKTPAGGDAGGPKARPAATPNGPPLGRIGGERRQFMSDKVGKIHASGAAAAVKKPDGEKDEEDTAEFRQILRDVWKLVMPELGKKEAGQYRQAQIRALGGTPEKRKMINYKAYQRNLAKDKERVKAALEEQKILGVQTSVNSHLHHKEVDKVLRKKKELAKEKKRRREDGLMRLGMGAREKGGMAIIPNSAIKAFQRKSSSSFGLGR